MGCPLQIEERDGTVYVSGNTCRRGEEYGRAEFTCPTRTLTTLVRLSGGGVASVKTSRPIPKAKLKDVAEYVGKLTVDDDVKIGDVIAENALSLGADIVITGTPTSC